MLLTTSSRVLDIPWTTQTTWIVTTGCLFHSVMCWTFPLALLCWKIHGPAGKTSLIWSIAINIRRNRKYFYDENLICCKTGSHNFAFQQPFARWHQFNTTTNKTHFVFPFIFSCGYSKEAYLTRFAAMLQNLLLVLVARFTLAFSLQCRRFFRAREFFLLVKVPCWNFSPNPPLS